MVRQLPKTGNFLSNMVFFWNIKKFLLSRKLILAKIFFIILAALSGVTFYPKIFSSLLFFSPLLLSLASLMLALPGQYKKSFALLKKSPKHKEIENSLPFEKFTSPLQIENVNEVYPFFSLKRWNKISSFGSPIFHTGLLFLIIGGFQHFLWACETDFPLVVGESITPKKEDLGYRKEGYFSAPLGTYPYLFLEAVSPVFYPSGNLKMLSVKIKSEKSMKSEELKINQQLALGNENLFLTNEFGRAILIEWNIGSEKLKELYFLRYEKNGYKGSYFLNSMNLDLYFHTDIKDNPETSFRLETRIVQNGGLLLATAFYLGKTVTVKENLSLRFLGYPYFVRVKITSDPSTMVVYSAFILMLLGSCMMFLLVKNERFPNIKKEKTSVFLLLTFILIFPACTSKISKKEGYSLVEKYNAVVAEAYRRCDIRLIDEVVALNSISGKKLTGLIGVRFDMGISLDSKLQKLQVIKVEEFENSLRIYTNEQWKYRDRKIGTGEILGEESLDSYALLYIFKRFDRKWLVTETKFISPPKVARKTTPWAGDRKIMHGF